MHGLPVTIRTIDVGADKPLDLRGDDFETALNPALGLRAIRWSLSEPGMFLTQLRALLRASAFGPVRLLIPMLAHAERDRPDAGPDRPGAAPSWTSAASRTTRA